MSKALVRRETDKAIGVFAVAAISGAGFLASKAEKSNYC